VKVVEIIKKIKITNKTSINGIKLISGALFDEAACSERAKILGGRVVADFCWNSMA
jgi:hypothetical protein